MSLKSVDVIVFVWMLSAFVAFGLVANLIDNYGVLYNLGQGVFISLFSGLGLYLYFRLKSRQHKSPDEGFSHVEN